MLSPHDMQCYPMIRDEMKRTEFPVKGRPHTFAQPTIYRCKCDDDYNDDDDDNDYNDHDDNDYNDDDGDDDSGGGSSYQNGRTELEQ